MILAHIRHGRVAEWPIASVLKTEVGQPTVGSNPTSSDQTKKPTNRWVFLFFHSSSRSDFGVRKFICAFLHIDLSMCAWWRNAC